MRKSTLLKTFSIATIWILVLNILAIVTPAVMAQPNATIETSRDVFYENDGVKITVTDPEQTAANITIEVWIGSSKVGEFILLQVATAVYSGVVILDQVAGLNPGNEGTEVTLRYQDVPSYQFVTYTLTYDHTPSTATRDRSMHPPGATVHITLNAPDLNADPEIDEDVTAYVTATIKDLSKGTGPDTLTITATETGDNTGVFDVTFTLPSTIGGESVDVGDTVEVILSVNKYPDTAAPTETHTLRFTVYTEVGVISEVSTPTFSDELSLNVTDFDLNKDATVKDTATGLVIVYVEDSSGTIFDKVILDLKETAKDSSIFAGEVTISWNTTSSPDQTDSVLVVYPLDESLSTIKINYTDPSEGGAVVSTRTVKMAYSMASIESDKTEAVRTSKIKITLTDPDLNDDAATAEFLKFTLANKSIVEDVPIYHVGLGIEVGKLSIYGYDGDGNKYVLNWTSTTYASKDFYLFETGDNTGIFELTTFDLSNLNITDDIVEVKLVFEDYSTPDFTADTTSFTIAIVVASLSVDRTTIPLSKHGPVVGVTVVDPTADTTWSKDTVTVTVKAYNATEDVVKTYTVTLEETDIRSGEFTGTFTLPSGDVVPSLIGGYLKVYYGDLSKKVTFTLHSASVSVNATEVAYGEAIKITITDPDWNLDVTSEDKITLNIKDNTGANIEAKETGPDTGVFEAVFTVAADAEEGYVDIPVGESVTFTYTDNTPPFATPDMIDWPAGIEFEYAFTVKTFTATLELSATEVGPKSTLVITITDLDENNLIEDANSVDFSIKKPDGTIITKTAGETGDNTGVFEYELDVSTLGSPADIIGKQFAVIYREGADATGKPLSHVEYFTVTSWDGVVVFDKNVYNVGDLAYINVTDPDANLDPDSIEYLYVLVTSDSDPLGTRVTLVETGVDTGVFTGSVLLSDTIGSGRVYVEYGDTIKVEYTDEFPADYGVTGKSKTFTATARIGVIVEFPASVSPEEVSFIDASGNVITEITAGVPMAFSVPVENLGYEDMTFTAFIVITKDGVPVYVTFSSGVAPAQGMTTVGLGWTPTEPGTYHVKIVVWKSLTDRTPLMETAVEFDVTVS